MRTPRAVLAGVAVAVAMLPLGVAAQTDGDESAGATSDSPAEVSVIKDLVYATGSSPDGEGTELKLRVHVTAESEDAPMVVSVGGSAVNSKALAEQGVSVFVTGSPPLQWSEVVLHADPTVVRAAVEAVACAVRFARGSEYGSETAPLVLTGWSLDGGPPAHVALVGEDFDRVWDEYAESAGGPPSQFECTASDASTRVDGFMGVAGAYDAFVGYEGRYGRDLLMEHEPELWEMLYGAVGVHPELRVRLVHGEDDSTVSPENSAAFEAVLAEAGYDVELVEFAGGHITPGDLTIETVMELLQ